MQVAKPRRKLLRPSNEQMLAALEIYAHVLIWVDACIVNRLLHGYLAQLQTDYVIIGRVDGMLYA